MRQVYHAQLPLACRGSHPRSAELAEMSRLLDANRLALKAVQTDLLRISSADARRGRKGMSAEQVVRAAIVKQMLSVSYDELAFRLSDSLQLRGFCRLSLAEDAPVKSTLQANIGAIRAETREALNRALMKDARSSKIEDGSWMRADSTVVESNIHHRSIKTCRGTASECSRGPCCDLMTSTGRRERTSGYGRSDGASRSSTPGEWTNGYRSTATSRRSLARPFMQQRPRRRS